MALEPTREAWGQIRYDYEHTGRPIEDICAEHGISSGTLRDRMRRWGWARRRLPIPREGPPPAPPIDHAILLLPVTQTGPVAPALASAPASASPITPSAPGLPTMPQAAAIEHASDGGDSDPVSIVPRLQNAVGRVLPAIEAIVTRLGANPANAREMERSARALASLTRTLRELNVLLGQHRASAAEDNMPEDIDAFRLDLARRIDLFVASRTGEGEADSEAQEA